MAIDVPLTATGHADGAVAPPADDRPPFAGPRDALEEELVQIWQDLLRVAPIGIHDDFFQLGGQSLIAPALVTQVAETFDRPVPLSLLLENPTLAGFADALVRASREEGRSVVTLRADGDRPPLFFLHGDVNGGGLYCVRLSRGLSSQPFHTLEPLGCTGGHVPASIEEMASQHAAAIRNVRPHGPYLLGGHCSGALEALEIAGRLRKDGDDVPAVVLIQPPTVDIRLRAIAVPVGLAARVARFDDDRRVDLYLRARDAVARLSREPASGPTLAYRTLRRLFKLARVSSAAAAGTAPSPSSPTSLRHDLGLWRRYARAVAAYVPRRYDGSAAVLVADDDREGGVDSIAAWRRVGPRFEFHAVRGNHLGCITTHVDTTSAVIDAYLGRALR